MYNLYDIPRHFTLLLLGYTENVAKEFIIKNIFIFVGMDLFIGGSVWGCIGSNSLKLLYLDKQTQGLKCMPGC